MADPVDIDESLARLREATEEKRSERQRKLIRLKSTNKTERPAGTSRWDREDEGRNKESKESRAEREARRKVQQEARDRDRLDLNARREALKEKQRLRLEGLASSGLSSVTVSPGDSLEERMARLEAKAAERKRLRELDGEQRRIRTDERKIKAMEGDPSLFANTPDISLPSTPIKKVPSSALSSVAVKSSSRVVEGPTPTDTAMQSNATPLNNAAPLGLVTPQATRNVGTNLGSPPPYTDTPLSTPVQAKGKPEKNKRAEEKNKQGEASVTTKTNETADSIAAQLASEARSAQPNTKATGSPSTVLNSNKQQSSQQIEGRQGKRQEEGETAVDETPPLVRILAAQGISSPAADAKEINDPGTSARKQQPSAIDSFFPLEITEQEVRVPAPLSSTPARRSPSLPHLDSLAMFSQSVSISHLADIEQADREGEDVVEAEHSRSNSAVASKSSTVMGGVLRMREVEGNDLFHLNGAAAEWAEKEMEGIAINKAALAMALFEAAERKEREMEEKKKKTEEQTNKALEGADQIRTEASSQGDETYNATFDADLLDDDDMNDEERAIAAELAALEEEDRLAELLEAEGANRGFAVEAGGQGGKTAGRSSLNALTGAKGVEEADEFDEVWQDVENKNRGDSGGAKSKPKKQKGVQWGSDIEDEVGQTSPSCSKTNKNGHAAGVVIAVDEDATGITTALLNKLNLPPTTALNEYYDSNTITEQEEKKEKETKTANESLQVEPLDKSLPATPMNRAGGNNIDEQEELKGGPTFGDNSSSKIASSSSSSSSLMDNISYAEAEAYLLARDVTGFAKHIERTDFRPLGAGKKLRRKLTGLPKLKSKELSKERDMVFCVALMTMAKASNNAEERKFEVESTVPHRMFTAIYRLCTSSTAACPPIGAHWSTIGFQGTDPSTDLRGGGMLGLLLLFNFLTYYPELAFKMLQLSHDQHQNYPFCVASLNMTGVLLKTLRTGSLNGSMRRAGSCWSVVKQCHAALMYKFYQEWRENKHTVMSFGPVKDAIAKMATRKPKLLLKALAAEVTEGPPESSSSSSS